MCARRFEKPHLAHIQIAEKKSTALRTRDDHSVWKPMQTMSESERRRSDESTLKIEGAVRTA